MRTVAEETMLLLHTRARPTDGNAEYDTFARNGPQLRLLAGAALMDLVLLGKVRITPLSPAGRRRRTLIGIFTAILVLTLFWGQPALLLLPGLRLPFALPFALPLGALFAFGSILPFFLVLGGGIMLSRAFQDTLILIDRTPTGDSALDIAVQQLERLGQQTSVRTYLRAFNRHSLPTLRDALLGRLEQDALVTPATPSRAFFGLVDRRRVQRERPEFQAIGERIHHLMLAHTTGDPQTDAHTLALLLLFAWNQYFRSVGWQLRAGLYQFFAPDEYAQLRAYLRQLRRSDAQSTAEAAAQIGADQYAALRAIALNVKRVSQEDSSSG